MPQQHEGETDPRPAPLPGPARVPRSSERKQAARARDGTCLDRARNDRDPQARIGLRRTGAGLRTRHARRRLGGAERACSSTFSERGERVAWGLGVERPRLRELGELLAALREPEPIDDLATRCSAGRLLKAALAHPPVNVNRPQVQQKVYMGARGRPRSAPDPDLLARRAGAAHHVAAGDHAAAGPGPYARLQHGRLSHAGAGARPRHRALAVPPGRRGASSSVGRGRAMTCR